ncbi:MAG: sugar transferase [Nitrospinae bacterium]|nr:sugar transferase [Nitrospinota bacterium]
MRTAIEERIDLVEGGSSEVMGRYKRVFDLLLAPLFFLLSLPLFILVALIIKLTDDGPVFFYQKRCGLHGKRFKMIKFRTMSRSSGAFKKNLKSDTDGPMFKKKDDPRITAIGKALRRLSLDELPQLINVMRGEMSLIGPRPLAKKEMMGNDLWRRTRLMVKPGLTGLWQVNGRGSGRFEDWVTYDMEYVNNWSPLMDVQILLATFSVVLRRKGAH